MPPPPGDVMTHEAVVDQVEKQGDPYDLDPAKIQ